MFWLQGINEAPKKSSIARDQGGGELPSLAAGQAAHRGDGRAGSVTAYLGPGKMWRWYSCLAKRDIHEEHKIPGTLGSRIN